MKERPILFSGEMVRAILSGSKTQTRRIIPNQPFYDGLWQAFYPWGDGGHGIYETEAEMCEEYTRLWLAHCRYGKPGDRLYVKESFCESKIRDRSVTDPFVLVHHAWRYKADAEGEPIQVLGHPAKTEAELFKWTSGRFMPRIAARITLEITDIRVEHLQEISVGDIEAEGTPNNPMQQPVYRNDAYQRIQDFKWLWNSINAKRGFGWESNPWVWVISFQKEQPK